jgi:hypothetical protein
LVGECGRQTKVTKAKGTRKVPWYWAEVHQRAFNYVKATITKEVVLAYPDYDKVFEIYTHASTKQLGLVITQSNRPLAFFSRKLSVQQQKYSVTKIELLAIVETLKEFKGMLWGQRIKVYTDHKNLTQDSLGLTSDRVYRWRLILEENSPETVYIKGIHNTVAEGGPDSRTARRRRTMMAVRKGGKGGRRRRGRQRRETETAVQATEDDHGGNARTLGRAFCRTDPTTRRQQHNNQMDDGSGDDGGSIEGDSGDNDNKDPIAIISNI